MEQIHLSIDYDGPALAKSEMDVRKVAKALTATAALIETTNHVLNGDRAKMEVKVKGTFRKGSFGFDVSIIQIIADGAQGTLDFIRSQNVQDIIITTAFLKELGLIKFDESLISILKRASGAILDGVEFVEGRAKLMFRGGMTMTTTSAVGKLIQDPGVRGHLEEVVRKPLADRSINKVKAQVKGHEPVCVRYSEIDSFIPPDPQDEIISEQRFNAVVRPDRVELTDFNKPWMVTNGTITYPVKMECPEFLKKVENAEHSFSNADEMYVEIRQVQKRIRGKLTTEYSITDVMDHQSRNQMSLDLFKMSSFTPLPVPTDHLPEISGSVEDQASNPSKSN